MLDETSPAPIDDVELDRRVKLLRDAQFLQPLDDGALQQIARRLEPVAFQRGEMILRTGDEPDRMYFIYQGKVRITRQNNDGGVQQLAVFDVGDYFGVDGLYHKRSRNADVTAITDVILYALDAADFAWMLKTWPAIEPYVRALLETHEIARRLKIDWLGEGEFIVLVTHRHWIRVVGETIGLIVLVSVFGLIVFGLAKFYSGGNAGLLVKLIWGVVLFLTLLLIVAILWAWREWRNDFFVVTNVRVSWRERVMFRATSRQETPLRTIQSLNVRTRNVISRALKVGDLVVRTFNSELYMTDVNHPERMKTLIEGFMLRSKRRAKQAELAEIRRTLRERLHLDDKDDLPPEEPTTLPPLAPEPPRRWNIFQSRVVEGETITYRKHWWVFIRRALVTNLVFFGALFLILVIVPALFFTGQSLAGPLLGGSALVLVISLFFWGYAYADWRNDLYRITGDVIIDREKKPWGAEISRSAPIKNIQSLRHEVSGIIGLLLDVGDVYINVGDDTFHFWGVHNPAQVHRDISHRMESIFAQEERERIRQEHERMATWLEIYHQETDDQRLSWDDILGKLR